MTERLARHSSPLRPPLRIPSPLPTLQSGSLDSDIGFLEQGIVNTASFTRELDLETTVGAVEPAKRFALHGSFPQTLGDPFGSLPSSATRISGVGGQSELPLDRRSGLNHTRPYPKNDNDKQASSLATDSQSSPSDTNSELPGRLERKVHRKLQRGRSFSTDLDRDAAWEHKRELYQMGYEAADPYVTQTTSAASNSAYNTKQKTWPRPSIKSPPRTWAWSLTDEDLEELRGSIDLGFGFSNDESYDLKSTLPALELYYAINRQYSPLDGINLRQTCSANSARDASSKKILQICCPGDNPSQVKTRLRHWAQAVACSIKQGFEIGDAAAF